jgi:stage II sporulation protein AB (anti-sigma F factor)
MENNMSMVFDAKSENEGLARMVISAFITELDPTIEELNDVKTAVSEAVTNSIIHGYNGTEGKVYMDCSLDMEENENHGTLKITVKDQGVGMIEYNGMYSIDDLMDVVDETDLELYQVIVTVDASTADLYLKNMKSMFMEMFMDDLYVESKLHNGTTVCMTKKIKNNRK